MSRNIGRQPAHTLQGVRVVDGLLHGNPIGAICDRSDRGTTWFNDGAGFHRDERPHRLVGCMCWCEARIVQVTEQDVWEGRTLSCGRARCQPPEGVS